MATRRRHRADNRPPIAPHPAGTGADGVEMARLVEEAERRTRETTALLEVSRVVASSLDLSEVLGAILDQLGAITEHTGASILLIRDEAFEFVAARSDTGTRAQIGARLALTVGSGIAAAIQRGETVIIDDVRSDEPLAADYREIIRAVGVPDRPPFNVIRSWMAVPLTLKDRVLGTLTISWTTPAYFTSDHARLARAFADQASIAIENAHLFAQTDRRKRELDALLQTSHAIASALELKPLLERILDELRHFVDYAGASVNLLRDGMLQQLAVRRPRGPAVTSEDTARGTPANTFERVGINSQAGEPLLIDDVHNDSAEARLFRSMYDGTIKGTAVEYIRSFMNLPLVARGEVVGILTVAHDQPGFLRAEHADLLRPLATQAAIAIENARLYEETRGSARRFEALSRADSELFRSLDLDTVLQALVDVTVDVLGTHKSMVSTWDADSRVMSLRASRNLGEPTLDYIRELFKQRTLRLEAPNAKEERYDDSLKAVIVTEDPSRAPLHLVPIIEAEGVGSMIEVPVESRDGRPLGFFSVSYTTEHHFDEAEQRLLTALAERAAAAISNAELFERAQQAASLEERQRLARELHDSVSQALYGIALGARTARTLLDRDPRAAVEPVDYVLSLAEVGLAEMRSLIFELRPESLESEGLIVAVRKQVEAVQARHGIQVEFQPCDEPDVPLPVKEAAYRIAQESLHNVIKHSLATEVRVILVSTADGLTLEVADNGRGFDSAGDFPGHLGLHSMRERAEKFGGLLTISSQPGAGTRVTATFATS
jgi:signal transduction histidine kinase